MMVEGILLCEAVGWSFLRALLFPTSALALMGSVALDMVGWVDERVED
jgi:hypothetical protein